MSCIDMSLIRQCIDLRNMSLLNEEEQEIAIDLQEQRDKEKEKMLHCTKESASKTISSDSSSASDSDRAMECPVCLDIPECSPVYKCANNHILCNKCFPEIVKTSNQCPMCGVKFDPTPERCFVTELYIATMWKCCKYAKYGCSKREIIKDELSRHELSCPKAPGDIVVIEEIMKDEKLMLQRKDVELALDLREQEQDNARASEINDEGLAEAILKSQEEEAVRAIGEEEDFQYCLRLEKEEQEREERILELQRSDFEYAQRLSSEINSS